MILLLSSDQTVDQPGPSLGDVPGIRLRHHQWKHRPGSQHSPRDQDDGGQQQQQQQQLLQQLQRRVAPLFLHERLAPSQKAAPGHCPDPGPAAGDGGEPPRGDGAPGDGRGAGGLEPGQMGRGLRQTEDREQAERLQ